MNERWNPWATLASLPDLLVGYRHLPTRIGGGIAGHSTRTGRPVVALAKGLTQVERNAALAHELIHHERGLQAHTPGMPATWAPRRAADETAVRREVARRLVPVTELAAFADELACAGEGVSPWQVADHFDVPWHVAATALDELTRWERGQ